MALTINGTDGIETNTDTGKIKVGAGDDLSIYHTGSQSRIENTTGELRIQSDTLQITDKEGNDMHIECNHDGNVELYYDNAKKAETVTGGFTVTGTCTATDFAGDGSALTGITTRTTPFRNLIINGAMQVAQRDTSTTTVGYGSVDRWKISSGSVDEAPAHFQEALTSSDTGPWEKGFRKALKVRNGNQTSGAGAGDYIEIDQEIEAQNVVQSNWQTTSASSYVTLSFWVKSSVAQNFYGYIRTNHNTKYLYAFETGSLSANTWTKVTKTIPGNAGLDIDNDATSGILLRFSPFYGTDYTGTRPLNAWASYDGASRTPDQTSTWYTTDEALLYLTGVQLEPGNTATDFEHKSYAQDLLECKRYCHVVRGDSNDMTGAVGWCGGSDGAFPYTLPVNMRAAPSFTPSGTWRLNCPGGNGSDQTGDLSWANTNLTFDAGWLYLASVSTASSAGQAAFLQFRSTDAKLIWSAEL